MSKKAWALFILMVLIASAIRFYDPTFRSLWGDEAHSFYLARDFSLQTTGALVKDSHLPVYFALLSVWTRLFGSSEYVLRLLSIFIGILGVLTFFFFSKRLFDEETALIGTLLLAFSPFAVMHSQEIRMYGLLMLFSILSCWLFWEILSGRKNFLRVAGYFLFSLFMLLTHVSGGLIIVAQLAYIAYYFWKEKRIEGTGGIIGCQALLFLMVLPLYLGIFFYNYGPGKSIAWDAPFSVFPWYLRFMLVFFVLTFGETIAPWNLLAVIPAVLVFGYLFVSSLRNLPNNCWVGNNRTAFLALITLLPIVIASLFLKPAMPKYLIVVLPYFLLLVTRSLVLIDMKFVRYGLLSAIILLQLYSVVNYFSLRDYFNSNQIEPWREITANIKKSFKPGDVVVVSNPFAAFNLTEYYLNDNENDSYPIFKLQDYEPQIAMASAARIWLITHIQDDRGLPPGYVEGAKIKINRKFWLISKLKYISYENTLVAKLPIKRHEAGSYRISVSLYERR